MGFQIGDKQIKFEDYKSLYIYRSSYPVVVEVIDFLQFWYDEGQELIFTTSGSTGKAKEIVHSKMAMLKSADYSQSFFKYKSNDNSLLSLPLSYVSGKMMLIRAIRSQLNFIIQNISSNPLKNIDQNIDFLALTPMQFINAHSENSIQLQKVKTILLGGSAVDESLERMIKSWNNSIYVGFGMTETLTHVALRKLNGVDKTDYYSAISPEFCFRTNAENCLVINAPHLPEEVISNDIVELLNDQQFYWKGRKDNIVNSGGIKLNVESIENVLNLYLSENLMLFGEDHKVLGQSLSLCIEGLRSDALIAELRIVMTKLDKYERPKKVYFLDKFEYTGNEKLMREKTIDRIKLSKAIDLGIN